MDDVFQILRSQLTLGQEIVKKIEQAIINKKLLSGQKLPTEKEMCEMFGVSRTAVREALQMLSAKGLISIKKGSGMYVNDFSAIPAGENLSLYLELNFDKQYALHLVHVRQILEPGVARLAAINRTEEDLQQIEANLVEFADDHIGSERHAQLDLDFHLRIAKASKNPIISLIMDPLFNQMPKIKSLIVSKVKHNNVLNALECHREIFQMIQDQDPDGAFQAMSEHLLIAEEDTKLLIQALEAETVSSSQ